MDKYKIALQILSVTTILLVYYLILRVLITHQKRKRLEPFSLNINYNDDSFESNSIKIISKISKFLSKLVIFNGISRTYDKYIYHNSRFNKGMDYISLKLIIGFIFTIIYSLSSFLLKFDINIIVIISLFIIGLLIPDFYCYLKDYNNKKNINNDLYSSIVLFSSNLNSNKSVINSLEDVIKNSKYPIKDEYKKILSDYKLGISLGDAFKRMYYRTRISSCKMIYSIILANDVNNMKYSFDVILKNLLEEEKLRSKLVKYKKVNRIVRDISFVLPVVVILVLYNTSDILRDILLGKYNTFVISIYFLIYIDYLLIIKLILGSDRDER